MNVRCDTLAKAFRATMNRTHPRPSPLEFEGWALLVAGELLNSFDYATLYECVLGQEITAHWSQRHQISEQSWNQVYWNGIQRAYKALPRHLSQWFTKHIAGFSPTAKVEKRRQNWDSDLCPRC